MAETKLNNQISYNGDYADKKLHVANLEELSTAWDGQEFVGAITIVEDFANGYPATLNFTSEYEWKIKHLTVDTLETLEGISDDASLDDYLEKGTTCNIADGSSYIYTGEEGNKWDKIVTQTTLDSVIDDTVRTAVGEITSGASESFDTLKEIEDWINAHSAETASIVGQQGKEGVQGERGEQG